VGLPALPIATWEPPCGSARQNLQPRDKFDYDNDSDSDPDNDYDNDYDYDNDNDSDPDYDPDPDFLAPEGRPKVAGRCSEERAKPPGSTPHPPGAPEGRLKCGAKNTECASAVAGSMPPASWASVAPRRLRLRNDAGSVVPVEGRR